ncbi:CDI toxin immunity protein [Numidum massiliense]|uniref:CDI toxin immunity protein n=1 Tax=Numidum massiliense TaxID=1522315 RepID=UPI0006D543AB|nr:hypothetical protein [Numidum massiliense]
MNLFDECIIALGENADVLSDERTKQYFSQLVDLFPITFYQRIDWEKVKVKRKIEYYGDIPTWLDELGISDMEVVLLWNYTDDPAVKTDIVSAVKVIDDITAVSWDTFMLSPSVGYVIEFYHEGEVTIGLPNSKIKESFDQNDRD